MAKNPLTVKAEPLKITMKTDYYELQVRIVDGPMSLVGRVVRVQFSFEQLDKIAEWEPTELFASLPLK